ncbi:MAG: fumarylacetoacetase [Bacteroidetes bacterium 37-13]|nr:MAG: fumarylacetoacetase [Bacteroidetes bacterium 37-13]
MSNTAKTTWVSVKPGSDFPIQNLPYGIFKTASHSPRAGVAIGDFILDLAVLGAAGKFSGIVQDVSVFSKPTLNSFIALGKPVTNKIRNRIIELLSEENTELQNDIALREQVFVNQSDATMLLPVQIPNYTDFYSSIEHATNVGKLFRPDNPLMPNWKHLPVGYHGRASSIVVSGTPIRRPKGQTKTDDMPMPVFGASKALDIELEMAFVVGKETDMGESVSTASAEDYIFGMLLFNDWSARDIQRWEYVPLGPFLGKNFGSSVSPWLVPLEALKNFRVEAPKKDTEILPYLQQSGLANFDIQLEVELTTPSGESAVISKSNTKYLYWSIAQQLAHHTVNGCNIQVGDMYASGTISGPTPDSLGSLLEITEGGKKALYLAEGIERKYLQDGDTITLRAFAEKDGVRIGFGSCVGTILPAHS